MSNPLPPCRLSLVFAAGVSIAVIIRRGPSNWFHVIKWNTATDTFELGQWLHGKIYAERCGLSPDGLLFVYFAAKRSHVRKTEGYRETYTAVSKPPYLTALAMWPEGSTWGGGGRFTKNLTLCLAYGNGRTRTPHDSKTEIFMSHMPIPHPNHPSGLLTIETNLERYRPNQDFLRDPTHYPKADWTGVDHASRPIFIREGRLYSYINNQEHLLRDFNQDSPYKLASPDWARTW